MIKQYSELIPLHEALKEMIDDFAAICNRAGVSFYLVYGTLLGAARHHDIIPWDDDVDLGMFRDDYKKLINYFKQNSEEYYELFCADTCMTHTQIFAKLVRTDGKYEYLTKYYTHPLGLSLDIFPLDDALPQSNLHQRMLGEWIVFLRKIVNSRAKLKNKQFKEKPMNRLMRSIAVLPFLWKDNHELLIYINSLCEKNNGKGCPNIINYSTTDKLSNENDPRTDWLPSTLLFLGDTEYRVPGKYEKILSHIYGNNWNELPPEKMREQHSHLNG